MSPSVPDIQFTCDACGRDVYFMDSGLYTYEYRNQCPYCLCSRHLMFGCLHLEPCGGLMRPAGTWLPSPVLLAQHCECGFWWVSYDEDWWAQLQPRRQTEMMNLALTETARLNHHRLLRFLAKPGYAAPPPPPIPDGDIDVRARVRQRPLVSGCADSHGASRS